MAKPTAFPTWATDTNYTGGVEAGTPTKVAPTAGRQAEGWEPAAKPPAQNFNWWKNLVYEWIKWTESQNIQEIVLGPFAGLSVANWAANIGGYVKSSGAGSYVVGLPIVQGGRFRTFSFDYLGNSVNDLTVYLKKNVAGTATQLATTIFTAPGGWSNLYSFLDYYAVSGPKVLTMVAASGITQTSGDFRTLGFWTGMSVTITGFANAGNNGVRTIQSIGGLAINFTSVAGLVNETGDGDEKVVPVPLDLTIADSSLYLEFQASGTDLQVFDIRYSRDDGSVVT